MQHGSTHTSSSALLPVLTVEDDELHPLTRACGVGRATPPPLPRARALDVTPEEPLVVVDEDLHLMTAAQWTH
jgi:hypothetical protein